ncbi:unnamed protein product [Adineta steineri]|uniref:Uncharacterized protein n=1 Tax=Adineta steineri TaxID=433720 RepID=A0A819HFQ6_9BILA|nr:unnamed protein product [Adineta steineri]CAF3895118.1 unnamed protein product [Adineta steineri]
MVHIHPTLTIKYILSIVAFGVMVYFITSCIQTYLVYPTQTRVSIRLNRSQLFPAVTICSGNPLRYDKYLLPLISYIKTHNLSSSPPNITQNDIYNSAFNLMIDLINKNKFEETFSYGFQLEDILLDCTYNGYNCRSMWIKSLSPILGNCYTFNRQTIDKNTNLFQINQINGNVQTLHNGLIMTFYLNIELYFPIIEYGLGLTAILHHPNEQPLIRYAGKRFSPGFEHTLVYEKSLTTYLGSPYTLCTQIITDDMKALYNLFDNNTEYVYSETVCLELCQQAFMYEQCECIYPIYFYLNYLNINGQLRRVRICTPWTSEYRCTIEARNRIANNPNLLQIRCPHCQSQCIIHKYSSDLSSLKGPSDSQKNYYKKLILSNSTIPIKSDFSMNSSYYLDRNYLKLSIIPLNSYETIYEEKATYIWSAFISDLGGQSGLWLGISALSIFNLIEYLHRKSQIIRLKRKAMAQVHPCETESISNNKY